jgi:hypothetical protein
MAIEVKPGESTSVGVTSEFIYRDETVRKIKELLKNLDPTYEKVVVFNRTKTCKVHIRFNGAKSLIIEVTNEEEDAKFRLTE